MVTLTPTQAAWRIAASVPDPEVPVLTIEDLGVLRAVEVDGDTVHVDITPTYSGCPAMDTIRDDVIMSLTAAGFAEVDVRLVLSPAWTTDWMSDAGKRKLEAYGIAPPSGRAAVGSLSRGHAPGGSGQRASDVGSGAWGAKGGPIRLVISVRCPRCGSLDTREVSRFGSTSCKSLFECRACLEPFDHFKVH